MADAPAYWLSALAEEAAQLADNRDAAGLSAILKRHAIYHGLSEKDLTALVAAEWARTGVVTVPGAGFLRGWIDA
jgi:hypothetical protein